MSINTCTDGNKNTLMPLSPLWTGKMISDGDNHIQR